MMAFADNQIKVLSSKLSRDYVRVRKNNGVELSYLEGWHVISEANRIFGFDGWDRETVEARCVWEGKEGSKLSSSYIAKVRVRVRAGDTTVVRDGTGYGFGTDDAKGDAHESALKEAETDATKRALVTFGNSFGLALYDKEQRFVRPSRKGKKPFRTKSQLEWKLRSSKGIDEGTYVEPIKLCSALKRAISNLDDIEAASGFWLYNHNLITALKDDLPDIRTNKGKHYADIISTIFAERLKELGTSVNSVGLAKQKSPKKVPAVERVPGRIDKTALPIGAQKRIRDKGHLKFVASQPCLICTRRPAHAHHLREAQPRAMGKKVSDEWTVPLCATHHRSLHDAGNEGKWWKQQKIEPFPVATELWNMTRAVSEKVEDADYSTIEVAI
jgi:DNA recombination protein Rad52